MFGSISSLSAPGGPAQIFPCVSDKIEARLDIKIRHLLVFEIVRVKSPVGKYEE